MPQSDFALAHNMPTKVFEANGFTHTGERAIAEETPVSFLFGGVPYAVMMASPGDTEDFAYGFCLSEGLIDRADELRALDVTRQGQGLAVDIRLAPEKMRGHLARRRAIEGRSSCGLCGVESADMLPQARPVEKVAPVEAQSIFMALRHLSANQPLNAATRAVHAAAFCARDGSILAAREDVGRHNALDKCIGAALRARLDPRDGFVVVTSRASFEMVEKTAFFGAPLLAAISAPTGLAIARAQALGLTLAAIARADSFAVFAGEIAETNAQEHRNVS
ncbi:FdhD protein [Rhodoblastus acidophilus]|uniref:formate dehydrogenase accessory sulfurtransferase FdhD n=1 Tax=Rhodoblastus acidophilus TaxID=1074 RepID=UPI0022249085|nr:formate dehydrogenase accessory sulfurtransferase FdhD [Rhodoblastus acidophilus]MCW2283887.1 FdhD protein [Rhodoblastus acidophilus]MCW2332583.1 FdhD protein [Rhodoblastus acidophilus]